MEYYYGSSQSYRKRARFYEAKKAARECGVVLPRDKPWYCGEMEGCCEWCRRFYKKNVKR